MDKIDHRLRDDQVMDNYVEKISSNISFFDICFDGDYGWFCDAYTSTLYKLDLLTNAITVEAIIPVYKDMQYGFIAKWKDLLILAPRAATKIMVYHIRDNYFSEIELDIKRMAEKDLFNLFSGVHIFDDSAFLIPGRFPAIVRLDLHTFRVEYFDLWHERLISKIENYDNKMVLFARCNCVFSDKILLPCWQRNIVLEFQFSTGRGRLIEFPKIFDGLSGMYIRGQELFLASKHNHMIFRCDLDGNVLEQIEIDELGETGISFLLECSGKTIIVPVHGTRIIQWDYDVYNCRKILNLVTEQKEDSYVGEIFPNVDILSCVKDDFGNIWMYSIFRDSILKLHVDTGEVEQIEIQLLERDKKKKAFWYMQVVQGIWEEDRLFSTEDFCNYCRSTDKEYREYGVCEESVGKYVFQIISKG